MATNDDYDLVLDVMLRGADGWHVIQEIRKRKSVPVMFLTARDTIQDRVKGFESGADDYLRKPFAFTELLARVPSLLRRRPPCKEDIVRVADLEIAPPEAPGDAQCDTH